jgi:hypothetical protein
VEINKATGDCHYPMNKDNCEKWMKEKLILNLPQNSVIILDNVSYCNVLLEKSPSVSTKTNDRMADRRMYFLST